MSVMTRLVSRHLRLVPLAGLFRRPRYAKRNSARPCTIAGALKPPRRGLDERARFFSPVLSGSRSPSCRRGASTRSGPSRWSPDPLVASSAKTVAVVANERRSVPYPPGVGRTIDLDARWPVFGRRRLSASAQQRIKPPLRTRIPGTAHIDTDVEPPPNGGAAGPAS